MGIKIMDKIKDSFHPKWKEIHHNDILSVELIYHSSGNSSMIKYHYNGRLVHEPITFLYKKTVNEPTFYAQTNSNVNICSKLELPLSYLFKK